ncbi:MAG: HNH endonuclease [Bacteroidaceae bacterium]|nr:HNH endonuclease [Bacteroidaceae bacterium]
MAFKYDYNKERTSVEWQRKVDEIRQRDNYTCQLCGTQNKQVQVHHTWYNQNLHYWESPNEQLITLCKDCHSKETDLVRGFKKIRPSLDSDIVRSFESLMKQGILLAKILNVFEKIGVEITMSPKTATRNDLQNSYHSQKLSIDERKQLFIQALQPFESKYDKDYIQAFQKYWLAEKAGTLRFEVGGNGHFLDAAGITTDYISLKLENWKSEYDFIRRQRESALLLDELEQLLKRKELDSTNNHWELQYGRIDSGYYHTSNRLLGKLLFDRGLFVKEVYKHDKFLNKEDRSLLCYPIESIEEEEHKNLSDFCFLYEANQAFKTKKKHNQAILSSISPHITRKSFYIEHGIKYPHNLKYDKSIQDVVNSLKFPIGIEYSYGCIWIRVHNPTHCDLLNQLNKVYDLELLTKINWSGASFLLKVPYNILYAMDSTQFDFRDDSFENGTMKSIKLPTEYKDITYYANKIGEIFKRRYT